MYSTREEVENWLNQMGIKNYVINEDLIVDVDGNVDISLKKLYFIPVKFGIVNGDFNCSHNELTSLEGCPAKVIGSFFCSNNELTSLEGCPEVVKGNFDCSNNNLTSLEGCPKKISGGFDCSYNKLTNLEYCPEKINNSFHCSDNELTDLKYCPEEIKGNFSCTNNKLSDFKYFPKEINGEYIFINKNKIKEDELFNFNCKIENVKEIHSSFNNYGNVGEFLKKVNYYKIKRENELLKEMIYVNNNITLNKKL